MVSLKLSGRLPTSDERNGLNVLAERLEDEPDQQHMLVAIVHCAQITTDPRTGRRAITIELHAVEGVPMDTPDGEHAHALWLQRWSDRTGNVPLPLDVGSGT